MRRRGTRRAGAAALGCLALGQGACGGAAAPGDGAPDDIVLIVIDTLRADHLGAWGYARPTSPNLDRLAAAGVRFESFFSSASWTRPAMATLHTGLYARSVGVYEERYDRLPEDVRTLAERLGEAGYLTLGITANPNVNAWFGFDQGFDAWLDSDVVFSWFMPVGDGQRAFEPEDAPLPTAAEVTDRALRLVDTHAAALAREPFYLQLLYVDPHYPYAAPEPYRQALGGGADRLSLYDAELRFADAEIGRLLAGLQARGLLERAFVAVTSDHGEGLLDHPHLPFGSRHGDHLYDSVLHVPLIFYGPGLPAGRVVGELASSVDLVPTLLEVAGIEVPPELPGRSLLPAARAGGAGADGPDRVFSETEWRYARKLSVRSASQRLVRNEDSAAFLRDGTHEGRELRPVEAEMLRRTPPVELVGPDLAAGPDLAVSLEAWDDATPRRVPERRDPEDVVTRGDGSVVPSARAEPVAPIDEALRAQLEALGYLGEAEGSGGRSGR